MTSLAMPKFRFSSNKSSHTRDSKDDTSFTSASAGASDEMHLATKQAEADCLTEIKDCFLKFGIRLPDETVFRYASFYHFNTEQAIDGIHEDNGNPYLKLSMEELEEQFETNAVFPLPKLRTRKNDSEVIYMRPSRFNANESDSDSLIASLCYVLNDLSRTPEQCRRGVTVIADMQDVKKENFSKDHCAKMMQALQGTMVPTRVEAFIIVSPPSWFGKVFKWMKSKVSKDFLKRVHVTQPDQLSHFLMDDYEMYLPDDLLNGRAVGPEICEDYVDRKVVQEQQQQ